MTQRAHSRRMSPRDPFDLALLEAVRASVNAARDVLRATASIKAATVARNPVRLSDARHALNNANAEAAIAKSNLAAAIEIEAESRL